MKNQYIGGLEQFTSLRRLGEKQGVVFLTAGGSYPKKHCVQTSFEIVTSKVFLLHARLKSHYKAWSYKKKKHKKTKVQSKSV